jgi:hypothetical protein
MVICSDAPLLRSLSSNVYPQPASSRGADAKLSGLEKPVKSSAYERPIRTLRAFAAPSALFQSGIEASSVNILRPSVDERLRHEIADQGTVVASLKEFTSARN